MKLAIVLAVMLFQTSVVGEPPALQHRVFVPIVAKTATWTTVCQATGKPFTDVVVVRREMYVSRQDGVIFKDCVPWATIPVNSAGEAGLNSMATNGRSIWIGYVSDANRITVSFISPDDRRIVPLADFGPAGERHNAGGLLHSNGKLFFGIGDNTVSNSAQDDSAAGGKVWLIDVVTGERAVVAKGVRNPWAHHKHRRPGCFRRRGRNEVRRSQLIQRRRELWLAVLRRP